MKKIAQFVVINLKLTKQELNLDVNMLIIKNVSLNGSKIKIHVQCVNKVH